MTKQDGRALKKLLKQAIEAVGPDLRGCMALPRKARVTAVKPAGGTYVCSVQPVLNDGRADPNAPVIPDVEIPCVWAGPNRGLICPPAEGELCDLGFYDGDPDSPFIMSFRPSSAPEAELDELMLQHSPGVRIGFKADGTVIIEAPKVEVKATEKATVTAPEIILDGQVKITKGLEVEKDIRSKGKIEAGGNIKAGGNINADGNIMASGQSDNHHTH
jgi:Uncharacterized protein conserved in bacteria